MKSAWCLKASRIRGVMTQGNVAATCCSHKINVKLGHAEATKLHCVNTNMSPMCEQHMILLLQHVAATCMSLRHEPPGAGSLKDSFSPEFHSS